MLTTIEHEREAVIQALLLTPPGQRDYRRLWNRLVDLLGVSQAGKRLK